jgi:hypothetical protein
MLFQDDHGKMNVHIAKKWRHGQTLKEVRAISALSTAGWDPLALRTEQLSDPNIGPILQELETGRRLGWKDIADRSPTYKSYWAQWKSLAVRNGMLERNWESANGLSQIAQIVISRRRVNYVLNELHGGPSRCHWCIDKTLNKVRQKFYWLQSRSDVENWCRERDISAASRGQPRPTDQESGSDAPVQPWGAIRKDSN